jgi:hypothetical protein
MSIPLERTMERLLSGYCAMERTPL